MALTISDVKGGQGEWTLKDGFSFILEMQIIAAPSDPVPGPLQVMQATGLPYNASYRYPLVGTPTETMERCKLQKVSVAPFGETGRTYKATISFAPYPADWEGPDEDGVVDPFAAPPVVRARGEDEEVAVMVDNAGSPVLNAAGDPFDPPITINVPVLTFDISRVERTFDLSRIENLQGHVNSAEWMGFPTGSVLCKSISPSQEFDSELQSTKWNVEYTFSIKYPIALDDGSEVSGWTKQVLDAGLRQLVSGVKKPITVEGAPVSQPVLLRENGTEAAPSDPPRYVNFDVYPPADFSILAFPSDTFTKGTPTGP